MSINKKGGIKMLKVQNYWEKMSNRFAFDKKFDKKNNHLINMQGINQKLLELAVYKTEMYSTDILYLINGLNNYFTVLEAKEIDIYFRNTGIDWFLDNDNFNYKEVPEHYRYIVKLVRENDDIILYHWTGNC